MKKNQYKGVEDKIRDMESKLVPILFSPRNPEITPSDQVAVDEVHRSLRFMKRLISAEMASSTEPQRFVDVVKRVALLQKAAHAWTEGRTLPPPTESGGSTPCSLIESCLTDDDIEYDYNKGEISGLAGYTVYNNPEFVGFPDDVDANDDFNFDDDGSTEGSQEEDGTGVGDQDEVQQWESEIEDAVQEPGAVTEGAEKEVIRVDYQREENREEEDEDEDDEDNEEVGSRNCCYKILFWGVIVVGVMSLMVGVPDFPDYHAPEMFLTPT